MNHNDCVQCKKPLIYSKYAIKDRSLCDCCLKLTVNAALIKQFDRSMDDKIKNFVQRDIPLVDFYNFAVFNRVLTNEEVDFFIQDNRSFYKEMTLKNKSTHMFIRPAEVKIFKRRTFIGQYTGIDFNQ